MIWGYYGCLEWAMYIPLSGGSSVGISNLPISTCAWCFRLSLSHVKAVVVLRLRKALNMVKDIIRLARPTLLSRCGSKGFKLLPGSAVHDVCVLVSGINELFRSMRGASRRFLVNMILASRSTVGRASIRFSARTTERHAFIEVLRQDVVVHRPPNPFAPSFPSSLL